MWRAPDIDSPPPPPQLRVYLSEQEATDEQCVNNMTDFTFSSRLHSPRHHLRYCNYGNKLSWVDFSKLPSSCYVYPSSVFYTFRTPSCITNTFMRKLAGGVLGRYIRESELDSTIDRRGGTYRSRDLFLLPRCHCTACNELLFVLLISNQRQNCKCTGIFPGGGEKRPSRVVGYPPPN